MKDLARSALVVTVVTLAAATAACGGESKQTAAPQAPAPATADTTPPPAPTTAPAPSTAADAGTTAAPAAPAAPKTTIRSFAFAATSGKVDKVGSGDGAFKGDGVKDLVFDVEIEGAAKALLVVTTDKDGTPTGDLGADTLVAGQTLPAQLAANLNQGKNTAGLVAYEGDKVVNAKDGSLSLTEGTHKLTLHLSTKDAPKGPYAVFAVLADDAVVKGPVATAAAPAATTKTPAKK